MDVKVRTSREKTIPNIAYSSQKFSFVFNDVIMNSENLGNFLYGCTGNSIGLSLDILYRGSDYAAHSYHQTLGPLSQKYESYDKVAIVKIHDDLVE